MVSKREYAYGIGDETVHNGEILKYGGAYNGYIHTIKAVREAGTAIFEKQIEI